MQLSELSLCNQLTQEGQNRLPNYVMALGAIARSFGRVEARYPATAANVTIGPAGAPPATFPANLYLIRQATSNRVTTLWSTLNLNPREVGVPLLSELTAPMIASILAYNVPKLDIQYIGPTAYDGYGQWESRQQMNQIYGGGFGGRSGTFTTDIDPTALQEANPQCTGYIQGKAITRYSGQDPEAVNKYLALRDVSTGFKIFPFISRSQYWDPATADWKSCDILRLGTTMTMDYIKSKSGLRRWLGSEFFPSLLGTPVVEVVQFNRTQHWNRVYPGLEKVLAMKAPKLPTKTEQVVTTTPLTDSLIKQIVLASDLGTIKEKIALDTVKQKVNQIEQSVRDFTYRKTEHTRNINRAKEDLATYERYIVEVTARMTAYQTQLQELQTNHETYGDPVVMKKLKESVTKAENEFVAAKKQYLESATVGEGNWVKNLEVGSKIVIDDIRYNNISILSQRGLDAIGHPITQIDFHTLEPSRIVVQGTRNKTPPVVLGGPYHVRLELVSGYGAIYLKPLNRNAVVGLHSSGDYIELKYHPHTNRVSFNKTQIDHYLGYTDYHAGCTGELSPILYNASTTQNPSLAIIGALAWLNTANERDGWGALWHWFPKPEEVTDYKAPEEKPVDPETPEAKAQAAMVAINQARATATNTTEATATVERLRAQLRAAVQQNGTANPVEIRTTPDGNLAAILRDMDRGATTIVQPARQVTIETPWGQVPTVPTLNLQEPIPVYNIITTPIEEPPQ